MDFPILNNHILFLNIAYGIVTLGLIIQDILWLRSLFVCAEAFMITYGVLTNNTSIVTWNLLFMVINLVRILRLLLEQKNIDIPLRGKGVYNKLFYEMSKREFVFFWNIGNIVTYDDSSFLLQQNMPQDNLTIILSGEVSMYKNIETKLEKKVIYLHKNDFVGELSFITREPSSLNFMANNKVECIVWSMEKLESLKSLNPNIHHIIYLTISKEITRTISNRYL